MDYLHDPPKKPPVFYPRFACLLATSGSFLLGISLGMLNGSLQWMAADLWPCSREELVRPSACLDGYTGPDPCVWPSSLECPAAQNRSSAARSAVFLGAFVVCLLGRRFQQWSFTWKNRITMCIYIKAGFLGAFAWDFKSVLLARLIAGAATGLIPLYVPHYISEMAPSAEKGRLGIMHQFMITVGILAAAIANSLFSAASPAAAQHVVLARSDQILWRTILGASLMVPAIFNLLLWPLHGTPTEYALRGEHEALSAMLGYIDPGKDRVDEYLNGLDDIFFEGSDLKAPPVVSTVGSLIDPRYRRMVLIGCIVSFLQIASGINLLVTASRQIFIMAGTTAGQSSKLSIMLMLFNVIMTLPALKLIDTLGRRQLMIYGSLTQAAGVCLTLVGQYLPEYKMGAVCSVGGIFLFMAAFSSGMGPVLWVWFTEIFPPEVEGAASSLMVAINWAAGMASVYYGTIFKLDADSNKMVFQALLFTNLLSCWFCKEFVPEIRCRKAKLQPTEEKFDQPGPYEALY